MDDIEKILMKIDSYSIQMEKVRQKRNFYMDTIDGFFCETIQLLSTSKKMGHKFCIVGGYHSNGDGGGGIFVWSDDSSVEPNGGTIIAASNGTWHRVYSGPVDVRWFGARSDIDDNDDETITSNTVSIQNAVNFIKMQSTKKKLLCDLPLKINQTIKLNSALISIQGNTGGWSRGIGSPTFKWCGPIGGTMFDLTKDYGFDFEGVSFDGNHRAGTAVLIQHNNISVQNGSFRKCSFINCRDQCVDLGGGLDYISDDISTLLFSNCHFRRLPTQIDVDPPSYTSTQLIRIRGWNSYGITFQTCFFLGSQDGLKYGITCESGFFAIYSSVFHIQSSIGADIYLAEPPDEVIPGAFTATDIESQSYKFLDTFVKRDDYGPGKFGLPQKNTVLTNVRHISTDDPSSPLSIYWDGPGAGQNALFLIGCKWHHSVEFGAHVIKVIDIGSIFSPVGSPGFIFDENNTDIMSGI
jgi:hypothetical protein